MLFSGGKMVRFEFAAINFKKLEIRKCRDSRSVESKPASLLLFPMDTKRQVLVQKSTCLF